MANMSYCRFENTFSDLGDCINALERVLCDNERLSDREAHYAKMMRNYCEQYIEMMDDLSNVDDDECEEEEEETDEDFDHYEVCSDGLWYKFYERDNAVAFACRNEYPIYGVKDGKREPVEI